MSFQPFADRVLIKPDPEETQTASGLFLPETAKERPNTGTILAVGDGKMNKDGLRTPMESKPGDRVVFFKYAGQPVRFDTIDENNTSVGVDEYLVMNEGEILGRF